MINLLKNLGKKKFGKNQMVDEILGKYEIVHNRYYDTGDLYNILHDLGLVNMRQDNFTRDWLHRMISKGKLVLPEKSFGNWKISGKDIEGIVRAFVPGGSGSYNHSDEWAVTKDKGESENRAEV